MLIPGGQGRAGHCSISVRAAPASPSFPSAGWPGPGSREVTPAEAASPRGVTYDGHNLGGQGGAGPCREAGPLGRRPPAGQSLLGARRLVRSESLLLDGHLSPPGLPAAWPAPVHPGGPPLTGTRGLGEESAERMGMGRRPDPEAGFPGTPGTGPV